MRNKRYIGTVVDNKDPKRIGRVKARVMNLYDDMPDKDLPWISPSKGLNGKNFSTPSKGKIINVTFDDDSNPEYSTSEHYNPNLQQKIENINVDDYVSMSAILFDHKTQIYSNESDGLVLDYKYNRIRISENEIMLELKDNNSTILLGDNKAKENMILGKSFLDWFDNFLHDLIYGGFIGSVSPSPSLIKQYVEFKTKKDFIFKSHHVFAPKNDSINLKKLKGGRPDTAQYGDSWTSTKEENDLTEIKSEGFKPIKGPKKEYDKPVGGLDDNPPEASGDESVSNLKNKDPLKTNKDRLISNLNISDENQINIFDLPDSVRNLLRNIMNKSNQNNQGINLNEIQNNQTNRNGLSNDEKLSKSQFQNKIILDTSKTEDLNIKNMIKFLEYKNYNIYRQKNVLNIIGVRNKDNGIITNRFDETLYVIYLDEESEWRLKEYEITTVPGIILDSENYILHENSKILAFGQYVDLLELTDYGDKEGKALKFNNSAIYENKEKNRYTYNLNSVDKGDYGLMIRKGPTRGSSEFVFNHNYEGSQVFKNASDFEDFIELCEEQIEIKQTFTYTLIKKSEYENFI